MNEELTKLRDAFEAWMLDRGFEQFDLRTGHSGDYLDSEVDGRWQSWQAALTQRPAAQEVMATALARLRDAHRFNIASLRPAEVHAICFQALEDTQQATPEPVGEREAFEAAMREDRGWLLRNFRRGVNDEYIDLLTATAFGVWRIARKQKNPSRQVVPSTNSPELYAAVEAGIVDRYVVEKRSGGGFWGYCVKAGNGTREIFVGHKNSCDRVRQALQTACLDGAFMAQEQARALLAAQPVSAPEPIKPFFAASIASRKWAELQEQGHRMQSIQFDGGPGGAGSIDPWGKVTWGAPAAEQADDEEDAKWRDVALRFDKHRMQALWHLQAMLKDPQKHADVVRKFLADPTHPEAAAERAEPVAWLKQYEDVGGPWSFDPMVLLGPSKPQGYEAKYRPVAYCDTHAQPAPSQAEPLHIGACITDGKLHATVMRREPNGHVTTLAVAEMAVASLHAHDCIAQMVPAQPAREPMTDEHVAALRFLLGCFDAAEAEGLSQVLSETTDERLKDLVERRLMPAFHAAQQAKEGGGDV